MQSVRVYRCGKCKLVYAAPLISLNNNEKVACQICHEQINIEILHNELNPSNPTDVKTLTELGFFKPLKSILNK